MTRRETPIACMLSRADPDHNSRKTRILLVGGLAGSRASVEITLDWLIWFHTADEAEPFRARFAISAVPCANPDAWAAGEGPANQSGGDPTRGYPPPEPAYGSQTDPEAAYLWRWIGLHAPDLVVDVRAGDRTRWSFPAATASALGRLRPVLTPNTSATPPDALVNQLGLRAPANVGTVPAVQVHTPRTQLGEPLRMLLAALERVNFRGPSPARRELQRRLDRTPIQVARQLATRYGHQLDRVSYIPALALIGRLRLGRLTNDDRPLADVERIVAPYATDGKRSLSPRTSGSNLAGHLVFGELARITGKSVYTTLARAAADLAFDESGQPKPAMPAHSEMSDAVFMAGPILARVGRLTGQIKYFDMCGRHLRFMRRLVLRADGLYRHSPLDESAWGRGNGFPALGLALCLTDMPADHSARPEMLDAFRAHLTALSVHQDPTGAWHQVIDRPESYRELTATCMITFAMARGVRLGWLDAKTFNPAINRAWYAIRTRIAPDATLVDVCTGTGKQPSLRAYFDRTALLGPDPRGGAMALMVTTELAQREASKDP